MKNSFMKNPALFLLVFISAIIFQNCSNKDLDPKPIVDADKDLPAQWADVTLQTIRASFPNSPTFTSRCLGYIGLTMYESVVHGSTTHQSLSGQLNGIGQLPSPEAGHEYNWRLSLNAGQALI